MPEITGTRPLSWYADQTPPDDEDEERADREDREQQEDDHCDDELERRRER